MTCPISPRYSEFRETLHPCLPPYGFGNEDKTPYSMPRWQKIPANQTVLLSEFALKKMCPKPWRYHSAEELQTLPFQVRVFRLVTFCNIVLSYQEVYHTLHGDRPVNAEGYKMLCLLFFFSFNDSTNVIGKLSIQMFTSPQQISHWSLSILKCTNEHIE